MWNANFYVTKFSFFYFLRFCTFCLRFCNFLRAATINYNNFLIFWGVYNNLRLESPIIKGVKDKNSYHLNA